MRHDLSPSTPAPFLVRRSFANASGASRHVNRGLALTVRPLIDLWARFPHLPWPYGVVDRLGHVPSRVPGTSRETLTIGGRPAERTRTPRSRTDRVILYFHGGAFLVGGKRLHRSLVSHVADASEATAIAIEYRKLPKHPIAHAIADAVAAYREILASGTPPERITFVGDSAGGFLTFAAAAEARREGLPLPSALVAMSPLTVFEPESEAIASASRRCAVFTSAAIPAMLAMARRAHARAARTQTLAELRAPTEFDVAGFPRTLIQVGSAEYLHPHAEIMAAHLAAAGVSCELEVWEGQPHVFQASLDIAPEARDAIARIGRFVRR